MARSVADRALGLAALELNDLHAAREHLASSIAIANDLGKSDERHDSEMALASVLSVVGETNEALHLLRTLSHETRGQLRARSTALLALLLQRTGQNEEALDLYRRSLPMLRRSGAVHDEARALTNRAVLLTYKGEYSAAERDLARTELLAPLLGSGFAVAKVHHNQGFVAAYRGDIPAALSLYERAQAEYLSAGISTSAVLSDRAEALLSVGMAAEALAAVTLAVEEMHEGNSSPLDLAEAQLMQARAFLSVGLAREAIEAATASRHAFRMQDRKGWEIFSTYVIARARLNHRLFASRVLVTIAQDLESAGWLMHSLELRLAWAQRALRNRQGDDVVEQLAHVARHRARGPSQMRAFGWHAEALLRMMDGNEGGAHSAIRAGLNILNQSHSHIWSVELRVNAASRARSLALLGCRLAMESGKAASLFECAERGRAGSLRFQQVRPTMDKQVDRLLEELRHASWELNQAALEGLHTHGLLQKKSRLEMRIRERARTARGGGFGAILPHVTPDQIRSELHDRAMVTYVAIDGRLYAVTITHRSVRLHPLGPFRRISRELESLRFSHARLAKGLGSEASRSAFSAAAQHAAKELDRYLFGALQAEVQDRPLVVVPTGHLHHLPWAALSTCVGRSVSVVPSASLWHRVVSRTPSVLRKPVVLVAGPGMEHAEPEIKALKELYPAAESFLGEEATVSSVSQALDGAGIAHIAAHGNYRSDNPLFSSLRLDDGDLTMFNLERIARAPQLLILSACESGLSDVRPGDELLGLAAAILSQGTANLLASVVSVSDVDTAALMVEVHRRLLRGEPLTEAVPQARLSLDASGEASLISTAGFVTFGA